MMRAYVLLFSMLLAAACGLGEARAAVEQRVALVIGNGAYKNTIELPNAPADAKAVAASLKRLGFLVVEGTDLTYGGMTDKLKEFTRALGGADVGLVFYAGHGMQVAGENYLVPVDAALKREADLEFETIKVDVLLRQLQREAKVKIVILDACRDNPLVTELARSMAGNSKSKTRSASTAAGMSAIDAQGASGTMIAFATAPGTTALDGQGAHSPFTEALLANIETPGIDIDVMMKRVRGQVTRSTGERQQPWTNSSLTAEVYLNPGKEGQTQIAAIAPATEEASQTRGVATGPAFNPQQMEFALWSAAEASKTAADYNAYLTKYPNGTFADIARNRIAALQGQRPADARAGGPADEASENALGLGDDAWRVVQRKLTDLGFSTKGIDGEPGKGTRQAIRDWQQAKGYPVSGYLDRPQYVAMVGEAAVSGLAKEKAAAPATASGGGGGDEPVRRRSRSSDPPAGATAKAVGEVLGTAAGAAARAVVGRKLGLPF